MKLLNNNRIFRLLKVLTDILITLAIVRLFGFFIALAISYREMGNMNGFFISDSGTALQIIKWILLLIDWILVAFILLQLRKVFINMSGNQTFERENISRVLSIGYASILIGTTAVFQSLTLILLDMELTGMDIIVSRKIIGSLQFIFAGFTILVIAEVFRLGAAMYNEQKLTV
ncbi:DUF2975 domain-containing protein [Candidatus Omnitrophota bacterium]